MDPHGFHLLISYRTKWSIENFTHWWGTDDFDKPTGVEKGEPIILCSSNFSALHNSKSCSDHQCPTRSSLSQTGASELVLNRSSPKTKKKTLILLSPHFPFVQLSMLMVPITSTLQSGSHGKSFRSSTTSLKGHSNKRGEDEGENSAASNNFHQNAIPHVRLNPQAHWSQSQDASLACQSLYCELSAGYRGALEKFFPKSEADTRVDRTFKNHLAVFGIINTARVFIRRPSGHQN
jgi:hypothetical protein